MIRYSDLGDGTLRKELSPLREVPFYSEWLQLLLDRRAAYSYRQLHKRCKGLGCEYCNEGHETVIKPYDRTQEQACIANEDGTISVFCLACAAPTPYMDIVTTSRVGVKGGTKHIPVGKIVIGGVVQLSSEEQGTGSYNGRPISAVRKWKRMPVSKRGWGCPSCVEQFLIEEARLKTDYEGKRFIFDGLSKIYLSRGDVEKLATLSEPKPLSPFIDVFVRSVLPEQFTASQALRVG